MKNNILTCLLISTCIASTSCSEKLRLTGELRQNRPSSTLTNEGDEFLLPELSITVNSATPANAQSVISFTLAYKHVSSVNITAENTSWITTGDLVCDPPEISRIDLLNFTLKAQHCTGNGTLKLLVNPGTGRHRDDETTDSGAISTTLEIDNTRPLISVGNSIPASGDFNTEFIFPISISGAETIGLSADKISVATTGSVNCDSPVVTNENSPSPRVSLSHCSGTGTIGLVLAEGIAQDAAQNNNLITLSRLKTIVINLICPQGYVPVPRDNTLGGDDFCVMKYEAKAWADNNMDSIVDTGEIDVSGAVVNPALHAPASIAEGYPWRNITGNEAAAECESLGANYHLISNQEWMTIARNVEAEGQNWTGGQQGQGCLFRGNSGENTVGGNGLPSSVLDSCGYNGGLGPENGTDRDQRAQHTLSIATTIFDFAGNVFEWTDWDNDVPGAQQGPINCPISLVELPSVSCGPLSKSEYDSDDGQFSSSEGSGRFSGGLGGGAIRGGSWTSTESAGIYAIDLSAPLSSSYLFVGFRCVWRP